MRSSLSIFGCYRLAWNAFSKWWIPICAVSALVVATQIAPRFWLADEASVLAQKAQRLAQVVFTLNSANLYRAQTAFEDHALALMGEAARMGVVLVPIVAVLSILLIMVAHWATRGERDRRAGSMRVLYISVLNIPVTAVLALALCLFVIPGVYLYVRFFFFSLVMLEDPKTGPLNALRRSWELSRGSFGPLLGLIALNTMIQVVSALTIIGLIPATGFTNTARAAAFRQIARR